MAREKVYIGKKQQAKEAREQELEGIKKRLASKESLDSKIFADYPISSLTLQGLAAHNFKEMTPIQQMAIPHALRGRDILASARTGSGKTLAFLVPILERMHIERWATTFGAGAVVLSPTRELALQTFEVLKKIGAKHSISAGLIVGGNQVSYESKIAGNMAIIIATPGRLLHHMDSNPSFSVSECLILVLDEADRMLDLGFSKEIDAIVSHLPVHKQTLLFSATQTKSVSDLARLNMHRPLLLHADPAQANPRKARIHVREADSQADSQAAAVAKKSDSLGMDQGMAEEKNAETIRRENAMLLSTLPVGLEHKYIVVDLQAKVNVLFSFIKNHLRDKSIVFVATCSQAKFLFELFRQLRPGTSLSCLHGGLKQNKRLLIYRDFVHKSSGCMIATDLAARGLDFPGVNWIVMADCPMDVHEYIHRAGRTARFQSQGKSLLFLLPSEEAGMMKEFQRIGIEIDKIHVNPEKTESHLSAIESVLAMDSKLKEIAKKAFVHYAKSVFLMKNKEIFDVKALPFAEFSESIGLLAPPRIRFIERDAKKKQLGEARQNGNSSSGSDHDASDGNSEAASDASDHDGNRFETKPNNEEDEDWFTVRRDVVVEELDAEEVEEEQEAKRRAKEERKLRKKAKKAIRLGLVLGNKKTFGDDGADSGGDEDHSELAQRPLSIDDRRAFLQAQDDLDKAEAKRKREAVKLKKKEAARKRRNKEASEFGNSDDDDEGVAVVLASGASGDSDSNGSEEDAHKRFKADFERTNEIHDEEDLALRLLMG